MPNRKSFYQDIYDNSPDLIAVADLRTRKILDCNRTLLNKLQYTLQEVLAFDSFYDFYPSETHNEIKLIAQLYAKQGYLHNYEVILKKRDGSEFYATLSLSGIREKNGEMSYTRAVWRDINDLVKTRQKLVSPNQIFRHQIEQLGRGEKFFEDFYENSLDMFASAEIYDADNIRLITCNRAFARELGYTKEEIFRLGPFDIYPEDEWDKVRAMRKQLLSQGYIQHTQIVLKKKNGEFITTSFCAVLDRQDDGRAQSNSCLRNITELVETRHQLHKINSDLRRQNDEIKTFIHLLSHDMRSPIRSIDHLAEWILEDSAECLPSSSLNHLKTLKTRVERLENLVADLLIYLQEDASNSMELTDLASIFKELDQRFNLSVHMKLKLVDEIGAFNTNKILLGQVLYNLVSNAMKHHHQPDAMQIEVQGIKESDHYCFIVKDNGPGIDPKFHDYIFEPLKQLKTKRQVEGSGLGLTIVKKIILNQGGSIKLESEKGKGATFIFTWKQ